MTDNQDLDEAPHIYIPSLCDRNSLMMFSGPLDGVRASMYMAT